MAALTFPPRLDQFLEHLGRGDLEMNQDGVKARLEQLGGMVDGVAVQDY
jgi:hypothetical protein